MQSLKAQGKDASARLVEQEFKESWKKADTPLDGAMPAKEKPKQVASR
jgi:hypothetical protein